MYKTSHMYRIPWYHVTDRLTRPEVAGGGKSAERRVPKGLCSPY